MDLDSEEAPIVYNNISSVCTNLRVLYLTNCKIYKKILYFLTDHSSDHVSW